MNKIRNVALDRLRVGDLAVGIGLRQARTVDIAPAMKTAGFDWLFIDMEHNSMDLDMAVQICVAARACGISPIVRVPAFQHFHATRVLDGGAQGIVFPHVDDAETAAQLVDFCRYPPDGRRSITGTLPQIDFASIPIDQAAPAINDATLLVFMLESPKAISNVDSIAAVSGVDALLIGTSDLTMEMGIPGQLEHPDIIAAYEVMLDACKKHKKHPGMGGIYQPELLQKYIGMGVKLILAGSDLSLLMSAGKARVADIRAAQ
ncbi:MAG: aldolase/citrate lyase family protein [Rhodospirillales bacterium]|nr:aldolase/citrate lyase family protein [Rhodospirillales bacterium]